MPGQVGFFAFPLSNLPQPILVRMPLSALGWRGLLSSQA